MPRTAMTGFGFAVITFVCTLGSALLGTVIRKTIPETHLSKESQDAMRLGMGLVATMTALLLGLVTAAAKGSFDSQDAAVRNSAAGIVSLDRLLARYGPETQPTRDLLRRSVEFRLEATWPTKGSGAPLDSSLSESSASPTAERVEDQILALTPQSETQRWLKSEALKVTSEVLRTRWRLLGSASGAVPETFLIVVIFWLSMTFASFGLTAPRNATVVTVFVIATVSVAAAVFLIFELDSAFDGLIKIPSEPFRVALANLGR